MSPREPSTTAMHDETTHMMENSFSTAAIPVEEILEDSMNSFSTSASSVTCSVMSGSVYTYINDRTPSLSSDSVFTVTTSSGGDFCSGGSAAWTSSYNTSSVSTTSILDKTDSNDSDERWTTAAVSPTQREEEEAAAIPPKAKKAWQLREDWKNQPRRSTNNVDSTPKMPTRSQHRDSSTSPSINGGKRNRYSTSCDDNKKAAAKASLTIKPLDSKPTVVVRSSSNGSSTATSCDARSSDTTKESRWSGCGGSGKSNNTRDFDFRKPQRLASC